MSKHEIVTARYSSQAKRPGLLGGVITLPGETRELERWQAEGAIEAHPGLFSIVGEEHEPMVEDGQPDDLTALKGVGEQTELKLQRMGIHTFAALVTADAGEVAKVAGATPDAVERWQVEAESIAG